MYESVLVHTMAVDFRVGLRENLFPFQNRNLHENCVAQFCASILRGFSPEHGLYAQLGFAFIAGLHLVCVRNGYGKFLAHGLAGSD